MTRRSLVRREDRDGVAWPTLDRPEAYNALCLDLIRDLHAEIAAKIMVENMQAHDAAEGIDAFVAKRPPHWRHE